MRILPEKQSQGLHTSSDEPSTNRLSHSFTFPKRKSTLGRGTLSPKKIISGFSIPPHFSQDGTWN